MKYSLLTAVIAQALVSWRCAAAQASPRCKDENRNDVDWFIVYKLPETVSADENGRRSLDTNEIRFVYVDASNSINGLRYWPLSVQDLNKTENPVAYTLAPLYQETTRQDMLYFVYNDQPTTNGPKRNGHSKGVVLFGQDVGVWLLHSVPGFVKDLHKGVYELPDSSRKNAQMFMCVTFKTDQVDKIAELLRTQYASVHDNHVPDWIDRKRYTNVDMLAKNEFEKIKHGLVADLESYGGMQLRAYAKRATAGEDLYRVLARDIGGPIAVQSWRNGRGKRLPDVRDADCTVFNVVRMILRYDPENNVQFDATVDHSKWAISFDHDDFCFGSMNRMESQEENRGGEALCFNNPVVKALFRNSAVTESCRDERNEGGEQKRVRFERKEGKPEE